MRGCSYWWFIDRFSGSGCSINRVRSVDFDRARSRRCWDIHRLTHSWLVARLRWWCIAWFGWRWCIAWLGRRGRVAWLWWWWRIAWLGRRWSIAWFWRGISWLWFFVGWVRSVIRRWWFWIIVRRLRRSV